MRSNGEGECASLPAPSRRAEPLLRVAPAEPAPKLAIPGESSMHQLSTSRLRTPKEMHEFTVALEGQVKGPRKLLQGKAVRKHLPALSKAETARLMQGRHAHQKCVSQASIRTAAELIARFKKQPSRVLGSQGSMRFTDEQALQSHSMPSMRPRCASWRCTAVVACRMHPRHSSPPPPPSSRRDRKWRRRAMTQTMI